MRFLIEQYIDLAQENAPMVYAQPLIGGDNDAHEWRVTVTKRGVKVDIPAGSVTAYVRREILRDDWEEEPALKVSGSASGNVISVVLPADVYAMGCPLVAVVRVDAADGSAASVAVLRATSEKLIPGAVYDPDGEIADLDALMAQIQATKDAAAAANAAAEKANIAASHAPYIGEDGYWCVWDAVAGKYVGTSVPATGPVGPQGPPGQNGTGSGVADSVAWENVTGKPNTYPPESHTHAGYLAVNETAADARKLGGEDAGKYLLTQHRGFATPLEYGAKGDGVTDDTAAIKAAIQANSGAILFPPGVYLISETIELPQTQYSSLILNGAIIRQTIALNPMIKIGSDDAANFPMSVKGDGVIDMDARGGIGIQITNNAAYSHIDDVQVRNCTYGIGVLLGDGVEASRVSLQAELNSVKIYGKDSRYEGTALHVNAHDCMFNNLYLYVCKKGAVITGGGHTFNNVHVWGHAYADWTIEQYIATAGIEVTGSCFFNYLYLDSVCNGLITNGANQVINSLYYQNDITQAFGEEILNKIITKPESGKVIVTGAILGDAYSASNMKNKVFYIEGASATTQQAADERCVIVHNGLGKSYDIFDEANNLLVQKHSRHLIIPSSAVTKNKLYLFGYVKAVADVLDLILYRKYGFCVKIRMRVDAGTLTKYSVDIIESNQTDLMHFYYGTTIEKYGVKWIPLYFSYEAASSSFTLYAKGENYGENGFYPCICTKAEDLESFDTVECTELLLETTT